MFNTGKFLWVCAFTFFGLLGFVLLGGQDHQGVVQADSAPFVEERLQIAQIRYANQDELNRLITSYDVWDVEPDTQMVTIAADRQTIRNLVNDEWSFTLDPKLAELHLPTSAAGQRAPETFFGGYKTNDEIVAELQRLAADYPNLTKLVDYGDSFCKQTNGCETPGGETLPGRDLLALRISNKSITGTSTISGTQILSGTKPVFLLHAGIHARELAVQETSLRFAGWLLENYATNSTVKPIVDWQETWVIPVANPDGYDTVVLGTQPPYNTFPYSGSPLLHRKNGRVTSGCAWPSFVSNQFGVDLNRNHSFGWGPIGTSTNPCNTVFNGSGGGSEPETVAYERVIDALIIDQRGPNRTDEAPADTTGIAISLHSYGGDIIYSWGDGLSPDIAPNNDDLRGIADRLSKDNGYRPIQGNDFYSVSGATDDHIYGTYGIPSFTFELGTTFLQAYGETSTTIWNDNRPALLYAASIARAPYQLVKGPELNNLTYQITDSQLTIKGSVDDGQNGADTITAVTAQMSAPYPLPSTLQIAGTPDDGAFDSSAEQFTIGPVDLDEYECKGEFYLHGTDQTGQTGPIASVHVSSESCQDDHMIYLPVSPNN